MDRKKGKKCGREWIELFFLQIKKLIRLTIVYFEDIEVSGINFEKTWLDKFRSDFTFLSPRAKSSQLLSVKECLKALNRCGTLEENNKMNVAAVVTLLSFCATLALPGKCNYTLYALGAWGLWKEPSWVSFLSWWEVLTFFVFFRPFLFQCQ